MYTLAYTNNKGQISASFHEDTFDSFNVSYWSMNTLTFVTVLSMLQAIKNRKLRNSTLYRPVYMGVLASMAALWWSKVLWDSHNRYVSHLSYDELEEIARDKDPSEN